MYLFALEMQSMELLAEVESTTADRAWLDAQEFLSVGRADHVAIFSQIALRL
jgi:hypothetical protein